MTPYDWISEATTFLSGFDAPLSALFAFTVARWLLIEVRAFFNR
jgi:hypothetical protein